MVAGCVGPAPLAPPRALPVAAPAAIEENTVAALQAPVQPIKWKANPASQKIAAYQVWRHTATADTLIALVVATTYTPPKHGKYFIKAVNSRGTSPKSKTVTD